jgi:hypothetical protein
VYFNAKVGREGGFKPINGNQNLHETGSGNGFGVINFAASKILVIKSTIVPLRRIHKYTLELLLG